MGSQGPRLLGVRSLKVLNAFTVQFNWYGILPLEFKQGENAKTLNLTGLETYTLKCQDLKPKAHITVHVTTADGQTREFEAKVRIDTPKEMEYYQHGGILHYVLRNLSQQKAAV